jgi:hypothetical protein
MEFLPRQSAHFLHRMHTAHASTGIEPIPHQCLTVLANRQVDYQTALPAVKCLFKFYYNVLKTPDNKLNYAKNMHLKY